jgi:hypothetical protein
MRVMYQGSRNRLYLFTPGPAGKQERSEPSRVGPSNVKAVPDIFCAFWCGNCWPAVSPSEVRFADGQHLIISISPPLVKTLASPPHWAGVGGDTMPFCSRCSSRSRRNSSRFGSIRFSRSSFSSSCFAPNRSSRSSLNSSCLGPNCSSRSCRSSFRFGPTCFSRSSCSSSRRCFSRSGVGLTHDCHSSLVSLSSVAASCAKHTL